MCTACLNSHVRTYTRHMHYRHTEYALIHTYVYTYVDAHTRYGAVKQSNFCYHGTVCVYMVCGRAMGTYEISSSTRVLLVLRASDTA